MHKQIIHPSISSSYMFCVLSSLDTLLNLVRYMEVVGWTWLLPHVSIRFCNTLLGVFSALVCFWHCPDGVCSGLSGFSVICVLSICCSGVCWDTSGSFACVMGFGGCGSITDRMWRRLRLYSFPSDSTSTVWMWFATLFPHNSHFVMSFLCLESYHLVWCYGS